MRKTKITQEEFEETFWIDRNGLDHNSLRTTFIKIDCCGEFREFWINVNIEKKPFAFMYFKSFPVLEEKAMFRLMIAQEFIEQFNESLKEKDNELFSKKFRWRVH